VYGGWGGDQFNSISLEEQGAIPMEWIIEAEGEQ